MPLLRSRHSGDQPASASQEQTLLGQRLQLLTLNKDHLLGVQHRRSNLRVRLGFLAAAVLLAGVAWQGYQRYADESEAALARELESSLATAGDVDAPLLEAQGYLAAERLVKVTPRVAGIAIAINYEEGDLVRAGDVLARLDDERYQSELREAQAVVALCRARLEELRRGSREEEIRMAAASVEQAKSRFEYCSQEYKRNEALKSSVTRSRVDAARSDLLQAEAGLAEAKEALKLVQLGPRPEKIEAAAAELQRAEATLLKAEYFCRSTEIVAPIDGVLLEVLVEEGQAVSPETHGGGIFTIADLGTLVVKIDIAERDLAAVSVGQRCLISTETHPDGCYQGRLQWLAPMINRQRGIRHARIALVDPDNRLLPDMNCRVRLYASPTGKLLPTDSALPLTQSHINDSPDQEAA